MTEALSGDSISSRVSSERTDQVRMWVSVCPSVRPACCLQMRHRSSCSPAANSITASASSLCVVFIFSHWDVHKSLSHLFTPPHPPKKKKKRQALQLWSSSIHHPSLHYRTHLRVWTDVDVFATRIKSPVFFKPNSPFLIGWLELPDVMWPLCTSK